MPFSRWKSQIKYAVRRSSQRLIRPTLSTWFFDCLVKQNVGGPLATNTYFEFGVAGGNSLAEYLRAVELYSHLYNVPYSKFNLFGFDSFAGLPPKADAADDHVDWKEGQMRHSPADAEAKVRAFHFPMDQVRFVKGFFEESLTPALREELRTSSPAIVTLDCDYYSSTLTALSWLEPFVPTGSVFYFDDIWSFAGDPNRGQLKAIAEINSRGRIHLTPYPLFGLESYVYICSRHEDGK